MVRCTYTNKEENYYDLHRKQIKGNGLHIQKYDRLNT